MSDAAKGAVPEPATTSPAPSSGSPAAAGTAGLLRSSSVMAAGTVVSRLLGFVRNSVVYTALGTSLVGSTYTVANTIPNALYILLAGGVLNAVFIPQLVRAMRREDGGQAYSDRLLTLSGLVLLALTALATLAAPLLVRVYAGDFTGAEYATAVAFAYCLLPSIFFLGLFAVLGQVLNARGSFGPMMWAPVLNNVVVIAVGLLFIVVATVDKRDPGSLTGGEVALLGVGTALGLVVQALALVPVLRRTGFRYRPRFDFRGHGLGKAGELARWTIAFVAVNQLGYLVVVNVLTGVDKRAALSIPYGVGYAAYSNAFLIFQLPHGIVTVSVVTALLPRMSRAADSGSLAMLRADFSSGMRLTAVGLLPAAAAFVALGPQLTTVMFPGLSAASARYMGIVLSVFALGLVAFSGHYLALRGFYAQEDTRTPFTLNVWINAVNVGLVLLASRYLPLRWVAVGLAGSYAVSYYVGWSLSLTRLRRRIGGLDGSRVLRTYARLLLAAALAGAAAYGVGHLATAALGEGRRGALVAVTAGGLTLLAGYLALARALRVEELTDLLAVARGRLRR